MTDVIVVVILVVVWGALMTAMYLGWRRRARVQSPQIGTLPPVPESPGEIVLPAVTGLYVGSTLAPDWQNRIAVGDLGFRASGSLTRFDKGVLVDRDGATPIWIPRESIVDVRTDRALAGKVMTRDGLLVIRWRPGTGEDASTELDTGFRGDDKTVYPAWVDEQKKEAGA